jgi:hypothetical protein
MAMAGLCKIVSFLALGMAGAACAPAFGQTAAGTVAKAVVAAQPAPKTPKTDATHASDAAAATPRLTNSWVCASGMRLEIYPVSFDDPTAALQYVVVYKRDGGVVASERIDAKIARQFPAYGCNDSDLGDHSGLLG